MKNKIELAAKWEEKTYSCTLPYPDAAAAEVKGVASCPYCATKPFLAGGSGMSATPCGRGWVAHAGCVSCRAHVGTLTVWTNTLFGVEEDQRVSRMGVKIF